MDCLDVPAGMLDVKKRSCNHPACKKYPTLAHPGERPTRCAEHKSENMASVGKKCEHADCNIRASYGFNGSDIRCAEHCAVKESILSCPKAVEI
jgi:hypothetical protein